MTRSVLPALRLAFCVAMSAWAAGPAVAEGKEPGSVSDTATQRPVAATTIVSLDGEWLLVTDPKNVGRAEQWMAKARTEAKAAKVPWIIQGTFPNYYGLAWYWREFAVPANPHAGGRYLLRFWAVDYQAEVWVNGRSAGTHEGGETPFVLDVTDLVQPGAANLLAVRVLNPTNEPIDGIVLNQTAHRNKVIPYGAGSAWDQGGIMDSVELLLAPAVRVDDLFVRADWKTGEIRISAEVCNAAAAGAAGAGGAAARGVMEFTVAPAAAGETLAATRVERELAPGRSVVEARLRVDNPHLWELNDPFLYRVTARLRVGGTGAGVGGGAAGGGGGRRGENASVGGDTRREDAPESLDERSVRCGFRDFRFADGYFRLNGRRIYLRCSHTGNCCPAGLELPVDPDILHRDLINVKAMRFNAIRFISGVAKRYQLDMCDEIGLMVYEESYAGWCLADSPKMAERYNESVLGMVRRDRNHPSVTIWGLLNETPDGPVFRHAVSVLPALRALDDSRMVMLSSGRWDNVHGTGGLAGLEAWRNAARADPCVTRNGTDHVIKGLGITWAPGQLSFHPGKNGEFSVIRWTAPTAGQADLAATFTGIAEKATTDVHVLHDGKALFDSFINVKDCGNQARFTAAVQVKAGGSIDFVLGFGNGNYGADSTALAATIKAGGRTYDAAAEFSPRANPAGAWSYGQFAPPARPEARPDAATFARYTTGLTEAGIGSLSNPGRGVWEDVMDDQHPYQRVPHTADVIHTLRTFASTVKQPVFLSEYGIGSAVDLVRIVKHYEQIGKGDAMDAVFYRGLRDRFLADWRRWRMDDTFDRPEDYFTQCLAKMAGQRLLGLSAIRANPNLVGHSLTGTVDQGMTGEGLTTNFREPKPGTFEAIFDAFAPLRWCLFVEPVNVYRKSAVRLEAVLANEDALPPGKYAVRFQVFGPQAARVLDRQVTVTIADPHAKPEPPLAIPVFAEDVVIDGPAGRYRFVATFERGAAAAGEAVEFYVGDAATMPAVEGEVVLWGQDAELEKWLTEHAIRTRRFAVGDGATQTKREVILVAGTPPGAAPAAEFRELARHIARGSVAVFLSPGVLKKGDNPAGWLPLKDKGRLAGMRSWLYLKDEWAKAHPIFDGLPAGGLMDLTYYRDLIPDEAWAGQDPPAAEAVAGAINAAQDYSSGLLVAVHDLAAGRFVLNTLRIRENLARHPAAERLLRNMLRYAARDIAKPPADLPADFEAQLDAMGYKE